jgi:hypothetical protein
MNEMASGPTTPTEVAEVEPPWRQSARGSIYSDWDSLPEDIKSQLKAENGYSVIIGDFHYYVRQYETGDTIVYRNPKMGHETTRQQRHFNSEPIYRTVEVQALPIEQANILLATAEEYELIGVDPIKVVNGTFFALIGRKEKKKDETE